MPETGLTPVLQKAFQNWFYEDMEERICVKK
jgi:hypothetical protein